MTIGESIKRVRKKVGLTQAELADKLGISAAGIAQWENNIRNPKLETIKRIAAALEVSQFELLRPVMENDDDFVHSDWFGEMTEADIYAAMVPPEKMQKNDGKWRTATSHPNIPVNPVIFYYLLRLINSSKSVSEVVITREFAWNPRCVTIMSVN